MSESQYSRNITRLRQRWPGVAERVENAAPLPDAAVVDSRRGGPTLRVEGEDGRPIWMHSRYDPEKEADVQVARVGLGATDSVIVFGVGLGYPLLSLLRHGFETNFLIVIERDPAVLRAALERHCFRKFLEHDRAYLFVGEEPERIFSTLENEISRVFSGSVKLFSHPTSARAFPSYYDKALEESREFIRHGTVSIRSALYLSRVSLRNRFRNLEDYVAGDELRSYRDRFKGYPAIVVGAGPSLQNNVELLRQADGKAIIIAVSTALKVLLGRGIRPSFTNVIDYHSISSRYFEGIPREQAVPIICDLKANAESIAAYSGRRVFANDHLMNSLLEGLFDDKGSITFGATVAHAAFNIVRYFGCDPIILVGMDLSYPHGRHHVGGTAIQEQGFNETSRFYSYEMKEWEWYLSHRKQLVKVPGQDGGELWTSDVFASYLREFESLFAECDCRVIDATEGGALKRGAEMMSLADALDAYASRSIPRGDFETLGSSAGGEIDGEVVSERGARYERFEQALEILDSRLKEAHELDGIYKKCCRLLQRVVKKTGRGEAADADVLRVLRHRESLKRYGFLYFFLNNLAQSDLRARINRDLGIEGEKLSGIEKQHRQAERDLSYIRGLRKALEFMIEHLGEARQRFKSRVKSERALTV